MKVVGNHEVQREGLDAELAAAKSEVRRGREEKGRDEGAGEGVGAVREMHPVEIVGLYEVQREGLDAELAAAKSEVRWDHGGGQEGVRGREGKGTTREGGGRGRRSCRSGREVYNTLC